MCVFVYTCMLAIWNKYDFRKEEGKSPILKTNTELIPDSSFLPLGSMFFQMFDYTNGIVCHDRVL